MAERTLPGWPRGMMEDFAAAYVGLSVTTIHARQKAGDFPMPMALTPGRKVYLRDDLDAYLDRKAGRSQRQGPQGDPFLETLGA